MSGYSVLHIRDGESQAAAVDLPLERAEALAERIRARGDDAQVVPTPDVEDEREPDYGFHEEEREMAIETKIVNVNAGILKSMKRTSREMEDVINKMEAEGWTLVHNSRIGGAGGSLTFQRER